MNQMIRKIKSVNFKVIRTFCQESVDYTAFNQQNDKLLNEGEMKELERLESSMNNYQKRRIEQLAQAVTQLDIIEIQGLKRLIDEDKLFQQATRIPIRRDCQLQEMSQDTHPEPNHEWFNNQSVLKELFPGGLQEFAQVFNTIGSAGGSSQQSQSSGGQEQVKEQEKEEVKEQTNFDVELTAIDAAQKIKIIKEVRTLCGLGLKEAKEAVEKLPNVLAKQATKEDANKLVEALQKMGCTLVLK